MFEKSYLRRIYWRLASMIMLAVVAAMIVVSVASQRAYERELVPESAKSAITVGTSVRALLLKAHEYGIKLPELYGVDRAFADIFSENPEFAYLAITDRSGNRLHASGQEPPGVGDYFRSEQATTVLLASGMSATSTRLGKLHMVSLPIAGPEGALGALHIGIDSAFVDRILLEGLLDVIVVLVVSLFFTLELLNFMAGARLTEDLGAFLQLLGKARAGDFSGRAKSTAGEGIGGALGALDSRIARLNAAARRLAAQLQSALDGADAAGRERLRGAVESWDALRARCRFGDASATPDTAGEGLNRVRAPLFAFILAEELTRSFLPSYVSQLLVPVPWLSPQVVIGLPIVLFMLIVAIGQPYLGVWSERIGRRRAMLAGAVVAVAGFAATALAVNLYDLLLWRSLCAIGYAMVFVAAQGYVLDHTGPANRAQGFALFIGAIMVATVCGPSIGGILADNIGLRGTFTVSAVLAGLSILAIRQLPTEAARSAASRPSRPPHLREIVALIFNRRFMTLTGLAAMPAKVILTGVCFYLVPLYIVSIGDTRAMAGRLLMVYAVVMVLVVPLAAGLSNAVDRRERLVALGLCLSGMGGFVFQTFGNLYAVLFAVLMLGLGQALSIAAQSALVGDHCREEIRRYGDDAVYGVYRLLERMGNAIGPLLASVLVVAYGYDGAFIGISALVLVCGLLFAFLTRLAPPAATASA